LRKRRRGEGCAAAVGGPRSLMDAAKLNGLIIDRSKVGLDFSGATR
jgi:hypothetical protein